MQDMVMDGAAIEDYFRREDARSQPDPRVSSEFRSLYPNDMYSSEEDRERERRRSSASGASDYGGTGGHHYDAHGQGSSGGLRRGAVQQEESEEARSVGSEPSSQQPPLPCEQLVNEYEAARSPTRVRPAQRALLAASAAASAAARKDAQQQLLTAGVARRSAPLVKAPKLQGENLGGLAQPMHKKLAWA